MRGEKENSLQPRTEVIFFSRTFADFEIFPRKALRAKLTVNELLVKALALSCSTENCGLSSKIENAKHNLQAEVDSGNI